MSLLKNIFLSTFMSVALLVTSFSAHAAEDLLPGLTKEGVSQAMATVIETTDQIIKGLENGTDTDELLAMYKTTKQTAKMIVISGTADVPRSKGNSRMKKSRKAMKAGDTKKAIELAEKALEYYKTMEKKHFK